VSSSRRCGLAAEDPPQNEAWGLFLAKISAFLHLMSERLVRLNVIFTDICRFLRR
jgi:hypothetical protein